MTHFRNRFLFGILALATSGCLGEPTLEDRWTRLDILQPETPATVDSTGLVLRGSITYRRVLTGDVIAEVLYSESIGYDAVDLSSRAGKLDLLKDVRLVLANSISLGGASIPVTGWDHLIQGLELEIPFTPPPENAAGGLFLVLYFGDAEEEEAPNGEKIVHFRAAPFEEAEILPGGAELHAAAPAGAPR